jgi:quercetin dioxygenase-like cupin family protein
LSFLLKYRLLSFVFFAAKHYIAYYLFYRGYKMQFLNMEEIVEKELIPGYHAKFINSETMTFAHWRIEASAEFPEHSHPNEQVINMLEGEFIIRINGVDYHLGKDNVFIIPAGIPHSGKAVTDCKTVDVFYPKREDYK